MQNRINNWFLERFHWFHIKLKVVPLIGSLSHLGVYILIVDLPPSVVVGWWCHKP